MSDNERMGYFSGIHQRSGLRPEVRTAELLEEAFRQKFFTGNPVQVDIGQLSTQLEVQNRDLLRNQEEVIYAMRDANTNDEEYLGLLSKQAKTGVSINRKLQKAIQQRDESLFHLADQSVQLGLIREETEIGVNKLNDIDSSIKGVEGKISEVGAHLGNLLQDIGGKLDTLSYEEIQTRMQLLQSIYELKEVFTWSHREQVELFRSLIGLAGKPIQTEASETWEIGEKARLLGEFQDASKMFERSVDKNPSEARSYLSLGLVKIRLLKREEAKELLRKANIYGEENPKLQLYSFLILAKIFMQEEDYQTAYELLVEALSKDNENFDIWFELAVCNVKLGRKDEGLEIIMNLLKRKPEYLNKVFCEDKLSGIFVDISNYVHNVIYQKGLKERVLKLLKE